MAAGHPLTDEDRWPWLDTIAAWIDERVAAGEPAVVTCSALKIYRDKLRRQGVVFVYMQGTFDEVMECLSHRQGHFMKPSMLQSQSDILEEPGDDEIHVKRTHRPGRSRTRGHGRGRCPRPVSHLSAPLSLTSPHVRRIDELERRISELQLELKQCEGQQGRTGSVQTGYSGRPAQPVRSDRPN